MRKPKRGAYPNALFTAYSGAARLIPRRLTSGSAIRKPPDARSSPRQTAQPRDGSRPAQSEPNASQAGATPAHPPPPSNSSLTRIPRTEPLTAGAAPARCSGVRCSRTYPTSYPTPRMDGMSIASGVDFVHLSLSSEWTARRPRETHTAQRTQPKTCGCPVYPESRACCRARCCAASSAG